MVLSLVTGGAGFIGSHLVRTLLERGDRVRILDNFSSGKRENLVDLENYVVSGTLEIVEGDLRQLSLVRETVQEVDFIFHHAAFVSAPGSVEDPQTCFDINVAGSHYLFEAARIAGVQRVVIASSAAVYGDSENLPLSEAEPSRPKTPYAASKRVAEIYAQLYTELYGLPITTLRYFNVYGPRQSPHSDYAAVIPIFIRCLLDGKPPTIYGDGGQRRDFIYVGDVVRANLLACSHPRAAGKIFNICSGKETSLLELVNILKTVPPRFEPPRPGDIYRSLGDPSLAWQVLSFRAETSLEEGLRQTITWMQ